MIFYHKFFVFQQEVVGEFENKIVCAACVFLTCKMYNFLFQLNKFSHKLLLVCKSVGVPECKDINEDRIFIISEKILGYEFAILKYTGFDLNVDLPYKYIELMIDYFKIYLKNQKLLVITNNFINDSFKLPLILYYNPMYIALACIYQLHVHLKVNLVNTNGNVEWFRILDKNTDFDTIVELSELIKLIYNNKKNKKQQKENTIAVDLSQKRDSVRLKLDIFRKIINNSVKGELTTASNNITHKDNKNNIVSSSKISFSNSKISKKRKRKAKYKI